MAQSFIDRYEVLQLSQNASLETIERVYRLLAKRYHPDNQETGDSGKFAEVHEAYAVLSNPERRAAYDVTYDQQRSLQWKVFDQGAYGSTREQDKRVFQGILSLLYVARRRDPKNGGLGTIHLERMLGCPQEHLAFPLWYLRQRGLIETLDTGQLAITADGIDRLGEVEAGLPNDRLLAETSGTPPAEGRE